MLSVIKFVICYLSGSKVCKITILYRTCETAKTLAGEVRL